MVSVVKVCVVFSVLQVGARLISHAGSLTSLAKYPASTVQILGAEKALFRHVHQTTSDGLGVTIFVFRFVSGL